MLIFRDWNGAPVLDLYVRQLSITVSSDDGHHWELPAPILGSGGDSAVAPPPHSVEPKLARLSNGMVVLSSGRQGQFLWYTHEANLMGTPAADGRKVPLSAEQSARERPWASAHWDAFNIFEWHNSQFVGQAQNQGLLFPSVCVHGQASAPVCSTYYTSITILPASPGDAGDANVSSSILVAYDRTPNGRDPPTPGMDWGDVVFSVRLTLRLQTPSIARKSDDESAESAVPPTISFVPDFTIQARVKSSSRRSPAYYPSSHRSPAIPPLRCRPSCSMILGKMAGYDYQLNRSDTWSDDLPIDR